MRTSATAVTHRPSGGAWGGIGDGPGHGGHCGRSPFGPQDRCLSEGLVNNGYMYACVLLLYVNTYMKSIMRNSYSCMIISVPRPGENPGDPGKTPGQNRMTDRDRKEFRWQTFSQSVQGI